MKYGWLNIDKPSGITSAAAVGIVKRALNCKVGHAGTLDPMATGVLPMALGEATKVISFAVDAIKSYQFTVKWGCQRATDDAEGEVIRESALRPNLQSIKAILPQYCGYINQVPPRFSAIRVDGKRAFSLSRKGEEVSLKPREVYVENIELLHIDDQSHSADFSITCGKGVYIRSIARDMGLALGCFGYVSSLRRTMVGPFAANNALTLQQFQAAVGESRLGEFVLPIDYPLGNIWKISVDENIARMLKNGRKVSMEDVSLNGLYVMENCDMCYVVQAGNNPVAVCRVRNGAAKPVRVFNF